VLRRIGCRAVVSNVRLFVSSIPFPHAVPYHIRRGSSQLQLGRGRLQAALNITRSLGQRVTYQYTAVGV